MGVKFVYTPFVLWKMGRIRMLHQDHSNSTDTLTPKYTLVSRFRNITHTFHDICGFLNLIVRVR